MKSSSRTKREFLIYKEKEQSAMTPEQTPSTEDVEHILDLPYAGLRGRELVDQALRDGPECVLRLGSRQVKYFGAICIRKGIIWPREFFEHTVDELMDRS